MNDERLEFLAEKYLKYKKYFWCSCTSMKPFIISKTKPKGRWEHLTFENFVYYSKYNNPWVKPNVKV